MPAMYWIQFPILLCCTFLELGRSRSDALYRQLGLTEAEQAGLDLNFTYLLSGHHVFVEIAIFVENWCSFLWQNPNDCNAVIQEKLWTLQTL